MSIKIALVGNPNSGKTTLFNALTGANQYVGNWPGVTVEKKEGKIKWQKDVTLTDLPGIYSLSPYTPEEIVTRNYLVDENPDAIINIVDGTNLERNLYLTTQLLDFGIPTVIAINFMDIVKKRGIVLDLKKVSKSLGCKVIEISARKGEGIKEIALEAIALSGKKVEKKTDIFSSDVENALCAIEDVISANDIEESKKRWFAVKLFERDFDVVRHLEISEKNKEKIEGYIKEVENKYDDDCEGILTNERYDYVTKIVNKKIVGKDKMSISDKIDKIVTNRFLAIPIFAAVMFCVYFVAMGFGGFGVTGFFADASLGDNTIGWVESIFEWISNGVTNALESWGAWPWLVSLIVDGAIAGVGGVLSFVPQMLILFLFLTLLEECGYMSRVAFVFDRIFRRFGLSGKSIIPMFVATGCAVPGIMASRTIDQQSDRKLTIMTTGFIPCGAKMPIVFFLSGSVLSGVLGGGALGGALVAVSAYFIGILAVICSGIILKKFKAFAGKPSPFVMELPEYHAPAPLSVLRTTWERGWSFIKRAGTVILLASIVIWALSNITLETTVENETIGNDDNGSFKTEWVVIEDEEGNIIGREEVPTYEQVKHYHYYTSEETVIENGEEITVTKIDKIEEVEHEGLYFMQDGCNCKSILQVLGEGLSVVFKPLGFGDSWQTSVATILGLVAKEEVVGALETMAGNEDPSELFFNGSYLVAYSFMIFNLLCAPCFAAIGAIKREMNNKKWTWATLGWMTGLAYVASFVTYQLGMLFRWGSFGFGTIVAFICLAVFLYLLFKPAKFSLMSLCKNLFKKENNQA
ncbi:MAG: ferrous iron transport protein B [Clostridia bacterium]|nr:ferrous iron transport protein B [Clostridia bacterium]